MAFDGENFESLELRVLKRARAYLAVGWCQGGMGVQSEGRVPLVGRDVNNYALARYHCLAQAINHAWYDYVDLPEIEWRREASHVYDKIYNALRPDTERLQFVRWNDAPDRTQEQVLELVDGGIARLQEEVLTCPRT